MILILQKIGIILLCISVINFLWWMKYKDRPYKRKKGEKYFDYGGIVQHIIATFVGLVLGIATIISIGV